MANEASEIAQKLQGKTWQLGNIRVWGGAVFRPGDEVFEVLGIKAAGDRLDLEMSEGNDPKTRGETLSVSSPSGFSFTANGFQIAKASKIQWGKRTFAIPKGSKEPALNVD
jgi:hypothetical protein